jgi:hypothetical protein
MTWWKRWFAVVGYTLAGLEGVDDLVFHAGDDREPLWRRGQIVWCRLVG